MRIGFAGLGRMGGRMAANLARAGHEVALWNRSEDKAADLAAEIGQGVVGTPRALAKWAEIVVNMLADDAASDAVHCKPDGIFAARGGARWMLEMGTMSLDQIAALLADAPDGVGVVEAPVSRSSAKADAAKHHELCPGSKFWQKLDLLTERRVGCALTRLAVGTTFNIARTRVSGTLS